MASLSYTVSSGSVSYTGVRSTSKQTNKMKILFLQFCYMYIDASLDYTFSNFLRFPKKLLCIFHMLSETQSYQWKWDGFS